MEVLFKVAITFGIFNLKLTNIKIITIYDNICNFKYNYYLLYRMLVVELFTIGQKSIQQKTCIKCDTIYKCKKCKQDINI
jgi:hypothetical protein